MNSIYSRKLLQNCFTEHSKATGQHNVNTALKLHMNAGAGLLSIECRERDGEREIDRERESERQTGSGQDREGKRETER